MKKRLVPILLIGLCLLGALAFGSGKLAGIGIPQAKQGMLDLSTWDFHTQGPVALNGQWEFYWGQLWGPADFSKGNPSQLADLMNVPETWSKQEAGGGKYPARAMPPIA